MSVAHFFYKVFCHGVRPKYYFNSLLKTLEPDLVLDVGSRNGAESLHFRSICARAKIIAFEANPRLFEIMRDHPQLKAKEIEVRHCAVSNAQGEASFSIFNEAKGTGSLLPRIDKSTLENFTVKTTRIDQIPETARSKNTALWIDIEGCSDQALEGAEGMMSRVSMIHAEVEWAAKWKDQKLLPDLEKRMKTAGFVKIATELFPSKSGNVIWLKKDLASRRKVFSSVMKITFYYNLSRLAQAAGLQKRFPVAVAFTKRSIRKFLLGWNRPNSQDAQDSQESQLVEIYRLLRKKFGFFSMEKCLENRVLNPLGIQLLRIFVARFFLAVRRIPLSFSAGKEARTLFQDGIVVIPDFLPPSDFEKLRKEFCRVMADGQPGLYRIPHMSFHKKVTFNEIAKVPAPLKVFLDNPRLKELLEAAERKNFKFTALSLSNVTHEGAGAIHEDYTKNLHRDIFFSTHKAFFYIEDVTLSDGPFVYVKGSHRLTPKKLWWEYLGSLSRPPDGDLRFLLKKLNGKSGLHEFPVTGKANTLIIANTNGFHRRGDGIEGAQRNILVAVVRSNPFWI